MPLRFRAPMISDRDETLRILSTRETPSFSQAFGTYFLWAEEHKTKICINNKMLFIKYEHPFPRYELPKGARSQNDLKNAVELIIEDSRICGYENLLFSRLIQSEVEALNSAFPEKFEVTPSRNDFEYIYSSEDLANLKGKKYHSKRNHIAKFSKSYDWEYKAIDFENQKRYLDFFESWFQVKPESNANELAAIKKSFDFCDELGMEGGAIIVNGEIVACALGERINKETFLVHFEKALPEFSEAYSVINREFSKHLCNKGYAFINREEDLGIPGLRKAKLSYLPAILMEKHNARYKKYHN